MRQEDIEYLQSLAKEFDEAKRIKLNITTEEGASVIQISNELANLISERLFEIVGRSIQLTNQCTRIATPLVNQPSEASKESGNSGQ